MANLPELRFPECQHNRPVPSGTVTVTALPQLTCPWCEIEGLKVKLLTAHEEGKRKGLEEALAACEHVSKQHDNTEESASAMQAADDCVGAIRALLDAPEGK